MAHHTRELPDHDYTFGPLDPAVLRNLDEKTARSLNGESGGTWAPFPAVTIGGSGVDLLGPGATGGTGMGITTSPGNHVTHGRLDDNDYIAFDPAHVDTLRTLSMLVGPHSGDYCVTVIDTREYVGLRPIAGGIMSRSPGARFFSAPLRVHDKGIVSTITIQWSVASAHLSVPEHRPRVRIVRVDQFGNVEPLRLDPADTDLDGFMFMGSTASAAAFVASNGIQAYAYTPNRFAGDSVDVSSYVYLAEFIEESGPSAVTNGQMTRFASILVYHTAIPHLGPQ